MIIMMIFSNLHINTSVNRKDCYFLCSLSFDFHVKIQRGWFDPPELCSEGARTCVTFYYGLPPSVRRPQTPNIYTCWETRNGKLEKNGFKYMD